MRTDINICICFVVLMYNVAVVWLIISQVNLLHVCNLFTGMCDKSARFYKSGFLQIKLF